MELEPRWHCRLISSYPASSRALLVSTGLSVSTTDIWFKSSILAPDKNHTGIYSSFTIWKLFMEKLPLG
jgi:hypothetical protein